MASTSTASSRQDVLESRPMSRRSMEEIKQVQREPRSRTFTGKSGFVWPFHKAEITIQLPLKEKSSLPPGASKLRVVGRGGSGSQLRQVSLSNPAVLDSEPQLDVHHPRQLPEPEPAVFYPPSGRGGLGSLSTRPPTPLKPPVVIQSLLRRKRRRARSDEQSTIHEEPSSTRRQSVSSNPESGRMENRISNFSSDGHSFSISQTTDPEESTDEICPTCHEHRQRSLDQVTGPVLSPRQLAKSPATFKDSSETSISTNLSNSSGISFTHRQDFMNDLAQTWAGMDNRASFESDKHSPMTSLSPSVRRGEYTHHIPSSHLRGIDSDNSTTITSTPSRRDKISASKEPSSSSSTTHIYVSNHSTSHFDKLSTDNDPLMELGGYDAQCDWLVPLETHEDEHVISIARGAPSKIQSWTGEWNDDIKDVIKNLRRL